MTQALPHRARRRFTHALLPMLAAGVAACHLPDQRDFVASASRPPQPASATVPAQKPVPALVRIRFTDQAPDYGAALAAAVAKALSLKPDSLFTIEAAAPEASLAAEATHDGAEVAASVQQAGASTGQIVQSLVIEPGLSAIEVRVRVR